MGYIYKITNKEDGKIYIGQTTQILEDKVCNNKQKIAGGFIWKKE